MGAPIAVELVPPANGEMAQVLIATCSSAAGPDGCVLADAAAPRPARARVVVTFVEGYAGVRIEVTVASPESSRAPDAEVREAQFREADPLVERFRAAGLIAASLVSDLTSTRVRAAEPALHSPAVPTVSTAAPGEPPPEPSAALPDAPTAAPPRGAWTAALSLGTFVGFSLVRPRAGLALTADSAFRPSTVFFTTSASYEQAVARDAMGISDVRGRLGAGVGVFLPVARTALSLTGRARFELEDLRVSVSQPQTGRFDAASRILPGVAGDLELDWMLLQSLAVFANARIDWADAQVDVSVSDKPAAVLEPWSFAAGVGLAAFIR
jgi:hypothetical protein